MRRHVFPTFFYQTSIGIYDTGQNGRSRTNIYLFLNCRRNINLHIHKCPEKASMCQVPGSKRIVKKGHECSFQASKHLSFCPSIRKNQTTARNNILQGKLPFHQPKYQLTCTLLNAKTSEVCVSLCQNLLTAVFKAEPTHVLLLFKLRDNTDIWHKNTQ